MSLNATRAAPGGAWTAGLVAFVLELTPDDVLVPGRAGEVGATKVSREEWAWIQTAQRLADQYGPAEARPRPCSG